MFCDEYNRQKYCSVFLVIMEFFSVRYTVPSAKYDIFTNQKVWDALQECSRLYLQGVPHIRNGGHHDAIGVHDRLTGPGVVLEDAADGDGGFASLVLVIGDRNAP